MEESALREAAAQAREERRLKAEQRRADSKPRARRPRKDKDPNRPRVLKIRVKKPAEFALPPRPVKPVYPCVLCPDQSTAYLLPVHREQKSAFEGIVEPVVAVAGVDLPTEPATTDPVAGIDLVPSLPTIDPKPSRRRPEFAHLSCVRSTPELWIADIWDETKERSVRRVMGIDSIGRERWNLVSAALGWAIPSHHC